jgi:Flp pilus assembly protein TadG
MLNHRALMSFGRPLLGALPIRDRRGAAIVEMALVLPLFLTLLMGIVTYGEWFFTAHGVQQAANDAARATIGGLNATERATIAASSAQTSLRRAGALNPDGVSVQVDDDGSTLVVHLSYDASRDPLLHISPFLPSPGTTIQRSAAIRLESL